MKILLDNHNEQVASVVNICCERIGADLVDYSADESEYDLAIKNYEPSDDISNFDLHKTLFLTPKNVSPSGARYTLSKPFSPLELITFISEFSLQTMSAQAKQKMAQEFADASSVMKEIDAIDLANETASGGGASEDKAAGAQNFEALVDSFYNSSDDLPLSQLAQEFDGELDDDVPLNTLVQDAPDDVPLSAVAQSLADDTPLDAAASELADKIPDDIPLNAALENISDDTPLSLAADAIADDVPLSLAASEIADNTPFEGLKVAADDQSDSRDASISASDGAKESEAKNSAPKNEAAAEFIPLAQEEGDNTAPIALAGDDEDSAERQNFKSEPNLNDTLQDENFKISPESAKPESTEFSNLKAQEISQEPVGSVNLQTQTDAASDDFDADFSKIFDRISEGDYFGGSLDDFEATKKAFAAGAAAVAAGASASMSSAAAQNVPSQKDGGAMRAQNEASDGAPIALAGKEDIPFENLYNALPFENVQTSEPKNFADSGASSQNSGRNFGAKAFGGESSELSKEDFLRGSISAFEHNGFSGGASDTEAKNGSEGRGANGFARSSEAAQSDRRGKKPSAEELKSKLRDDLEAGIANTIEKFAGSKDAKDALKDFKINIDISFGDR